MATLIGWPFHKEVRRCPTLPQGPPCSTIGAESLSFRVRNVTGRFPLAMAAETLLIYVSKLASFSRELESSLPKLDAVPDRKSGTTKWTRISSHSPSKGGVLSIYRLISTGQLHESLVLASTSRLSTQ